MKSIGARGSLPPRVKCIITVRHAEKIELQFIQIGKTKRKVNIQQNSGKKSLCNTASAQTAKDHGRLSQVDPIGDINMYGQRTIFFR